MKKIISGKELQNKIMESIDLLCNTVKQTLGPKGNNVLIDHSLFSPFITNDGATIAKNIESEDEIINTILEIAKEASLKTNETVGDGTTTTLVLLQSILSSSLKEIENGTHPTILKKELDNSLNIVINNLNDFKEEINKDKLETIAKIAANDEQIGIFLSQIFQNVKTKNAINIEEVDRQALSVDYLKGYQIETELASDYFLESNQMDYRNANILLFNDALLDIDDIADVLNDAIKDNKNIVIFAEDFEKNLVQNIVLMNKNYEIKCCLLKIQAYGIQKRKIEKDIEIITNAKTIENSISLENIGKAKNIHITKENIRIDFDTNEDISKYIFDLEKEYQETQDDLYKNFYEKRIAMFSHGIANIQIGSKTKTETHEMKMRLDDALCALESAKDGVLLGGGVTLLKVGELLNEKNKSDSILKSALEIPFNQILTNAGINFNTIKKDMINNKFKKIYNVKEEKWEDASSSSILDSFNVTCEALKNAVSIATMLMTTTSLVINEYKNNINKENEYTEL